MPELNFWVGKTLAVGQNAILRRRLPGLNTRYPRGRVMPLDLVRFAEADDQGPVRRVLDVGANDGGTSLELAKWFPDAEFHAFEPIAATFATPRRRTEGHLRIKPHQLACGTTAGELTVVLQEDDQVNTLRDATIVQGGDGAAAGGTEVVTVTTVDEHCERCGWESIDLLKTDTEGFDLEVLRGAEQLLSCGAVRFVYSEVAFHGQPHHTSFCNLLSHLRPRGYILSGFYEPFRWGPAKSKLGFCNALFVREAVAVP